EQGAQAAAQPLASRGTRDPDDPRQAVLPDWRGGVDHGGSGLRAPVLGVGVQAPAAEEEPRGAAAVSQAGPRPRAPDQVPALHRAPHPGGRPEAAPRRGARHAPDGPRPQGHDHGGDPPENSGAAPRAPRSPEPRAVSGAGARRARRAQEPGGKWSPRLEFSVPNPYNAAWVGAWRSPVAHLTGGQGGAGSNPVALTIFYGNTRADSRICPSVFEGARWQA